MSPSSSARGGEAAVALAHRITDRDHAIVDSVYEHRVLTVAQIADLHFDGLERARKRLTQLTGLRVLARFRPHRPTGSSPYHYALDAHGAWLVATHRDVRVGDLAWTPASVFAAQTSRQLRHRVEANGFATRLICALRTAVPDADVSWHGQAACTRAYRDLVRPDSRLLIGRPGGRVLDAFLEWDRGTETLDRLQGKLDRYDDLAVGRDRPATVLLVLPTERRERNAHDALRPTPAVRLLTAIAEHHHADPLACNWRPAGRDERVALTDLAREAGGP